MQIIAGKHKGRKIVQLQGRGIRPTKSIFREAIFNILSSRIDFTDIKIIDLYSGTGSLSLESISRGAIRAFLVDNNYTHLKLAQDNAKAIGEIDKVTALKFDARNLPNAKEPCDLAFIDPPYFKNYIEDSLKSLSEKKWLKSGALVIVEAEGKYDIPLLENFEKLDERKYGNSKFILLCYK